MLFCIIAAFLVLLARLFYLQIIKGNEYRRLSESNCIRIQYIKPQRGLIFDRNGTLLVDNRPSFDVNIILKDAKPLHSTLDALSRYIHVPVQELLDRINQRSAPAFKSILLMEDVGRDVTSAIKAHQYELPGVGIDVVPRRQYIYKKSAAHLLGYLGEINADELRSGNYPEARSGDYVGRFGIEKIYEPYLRGRGGGRQVEVDAAGKVVRVLKTVDARQGHEIQLTIDSPLQRKTEELLEGKVGAIVAMDPETGYVLAMASSPSFDQNEFVNGISRDKWRVLIDNPDKPLQNKAIQALYPPASTYKIITALAGLEEGVVNDQTTVFCPGAYRFGDRTFRCWKRQGHGKMNVEDALTQSCDVFFYQVGRLVGVDKLADCATAFGLGSKTGIELGHEERGLIPTSQWKKRRTGVAWQAGETLSVAIGQGYNLVTPIQMAVLTSALANDGIRVKPLIVKQIRTVDGTVLIENQPQAIGRLPFSKKNLDRVRKALWKVVQGERGTGKIARIKDIDISGKTGTAQVISRKRNEDNPEEMLSKHLPHAWFVAYAPSGNPQIAVAVIVEHGEHGSSGAGPIARDLIQSYLAGKNKTDAEG